MLDVAIRHEVESDYPSIDRINHQAFGQTDEALIVRAVRASGEPFTSLVAELRSEIVGHILLSPATIISGSREWTAIALGPMSVRPDCQRRGIGSRLVEHGLSTSRKAGYTRAVVLGHTSYYPRFGFKPAQESGVRWEHAPPTPAFMALSLVPGAFDECTGIARYLPAFDPPAMSRNRRDRND